MLGLIYRKNQFLVVSSVTVFLKGYCPSREHGFFEECFPSHFFIAPVMIYAACNQFTSQFPHVASHVLRKDRRAFYLEFITAAPQGTRKRARMSSGPAVWFPVFLQIASSQIASKLNYCKDTGKQQPLLSLRVGLNSAPGTSLQGGGQRKPAHRARFLPV